MRVLLIAMPFGALDSPSLALGLLKASLGRLGVHCDVAYLNLAFATRLGTEPYRRITEFPQEILAPDWVFSGTLNEDDVGTAGAYVSRMLRAEAQLDEEDVDVVLAARSQAAPFLSSLLEEVSWSSLRSRRIHLRWSDDPIAGPREAGEAAPSSPAHRLRRPGLAW